MRRRLFLITCMALAFGAMRAHAEPLNTWSFAGFSEQEIRDYVDERVAVLAINRLTRRAVLTLEVEAGGIRRVEIPLTALDPHDRQIVPIVPVYADEAGARRALVDYRYMDEYGRLPVVFYRDDKGVIWPTAFNPQTAPRMMAVYQRAMDAARADERATRDAFVELGLWYMGARVPAQVRANPRATPSSTHAPGAVPEARIATSTAARQRAPSGVWSKPPVKRGVAIEQALGANPGKTFPVIDRFEHGVVTSIKSLDLGAKSYKNTRQLTSTVKRYIDKVAKFTGGSRAGVLVEKEQIVTRALDLVIPYVGTPAQRAALEKLVVYGQASSLPNKVKVNIIVFP